MFNVDLDAVATITCVTENGPEWLPFGDSLHQFVVDARVKASGKRIAIDEEDKISGNLFLSNWKSEIKPPIYEHLKLQVFGCSVGPDILAVSRLTIADSYKGIDTLIEAMPIILRELPFAQLRIVGGGDDTARLQELAARLEEVARGELLVGHDAELAAPADRVVVRHPPAVDADGEDHAEHEQFAPAPELEQFPLRSH